MAYKTVPAKRKLQKTFHLLLHLVAFSAGVLGVSAAFKYKHESGKADMITLHSWLGIATISLFGFQVTVTSHWQVLIRLILCSI